ncbi:hypothetical protein [Bacillus thuringiensis]|uniref:hypothetical protein n=1 Tax=Bacillus thuringiensis TaxID=1428 RepID=UPI000BFDC7D1|nr:hypothetical protein [Bacillus thuringiensis]PGT90023.1 hypothetical protein COD17_09745 [Bacillus thuringiensis]
MFTVEKIQAIKGEEIVLDTFKVKRMGDGVFRIIGYNYGEEEVKLTDTADKVAEWLNGYFGLRK